MNSQKYIKYPRTYHLPWSEGITSDDRVLSSIDHFIGKRVIITEKMDGENTTMYNDRIYARSIDSSGGEDRAWVKKFWSTFNYQIPEGWRVCGENLYAEHSIHYLDLESYFYGFSIWNNKNICLSWDDTKAWFKLLSDNIISVPVIFDGIFDKNKIIDLWDCSNRNNVEGYVVRLADEFSFKDFKYNVAKFVRKNHVTTDQHWRHKELIKNNLRANYD